MLHKNLLFVGLTAATLAACAGSSSVELEETDASEALGQELTPPRDLDTTRLYFGEPRQITIGGETPYFYGLFELVAGAQMAVQLHDTADYPSAVGFKFYRVKPNGKLALFAVIDGVNGAAAIGFRTAVGGSYLIEAVGESDPANLELELVCRNGRCAPTQQIGQTCAGFAALRCDEGLSCDFAEYACTMPDAGGTCRLHASRPLSCPPPNPAIDNRVCGCDGVTYWDRCHLRAAGASIASDGPCVPYDQIGSTCGGIAALQCPEGLVCMYAAYTCTTPDAAGTCQAPVEGLHCSPPNPAVDNRVCGCDGQTYWDGCHARSASASIAHDGPCEAANAPAPALAGACQPACNGAGTRSEGWYATCDGGDLIAWAKCGGCAAECREIGTAAEGWYSSCDGSLIIAKVCH